MRRREFVEAIAVSVFAWQFAARAEQTTIPSAGGRLVTLPNT
jgi:hypothetical protein